MEFRNNFKGSPFSRLSSNANILISVVANLHRTGALLWLIFKPERFRATSSEGINQYNLIEFNESKFKYVS